MNNNIEKIINYWKKLIMLLLGYKQITDEEEVNELFEKITKKEPLSYPNNYKEFPNNIYEPDNIIVDGEEYTRYRAKFNSLYDLYSYLKSEPRINRIIFKTLESEENDSDFAGVKYKEALEDLNNPPRTGFRDFLRLSEKLDNRALGYVKEYIEVKAPAGGYVDIPSFIAGDPLCYRATRSVYSPKFLRINIALSYYNGTTKEQVFNRALIIAALVNAFEQAGYIVEINTFELSNTSDELVEIDVNIKNNNQTFNKASLYKSICYVEFLRRILFRVLETLDVKKDWFHGYGYTCNESFIRKALKFDETDIFFDQPREMGIWGKDINSDFDSAINHLNLRDKIDVEAAKREFSKDIKTLKKTIK